MTALVSRSWRPGPITLRVGWGVLLLAVPGRVLSAGGWTDAGTGPRRVVRVLGVRHLVQSALEVRVPQVAPVWWIAVDALHAVSALGVATVSGPWRRVAVIDAVVAGGFAAAGRPRR